MPGKEARLSTIEGEAAKPDFWQAPDKAQAILKEKSGIEAVVIQYRRAEKAFGDVQALHDLAIEAKDEATLNEAGVTAVTVEQQIAALEFARMLSKPQDHANAIVDINAGEGGTEAMDWAAMLLRMYQRYCERKGWEVEVTDSLPGEEAGLKNVSFVVRGEYSYGHLKAEIGVHRLVRISPFDARGRRHTSFASVFAMPEVEDDIDVKIEEKDVRIDTFRASGAGGQKVNKTSSAVRITHMPTGIVVAVQNERSQHKNRDVAWKILRSRLYEMEVKKRDAERDKVESAKMEIGFGSQIRSYVLAPYRLVKDLRTGVEKGNVDAVLDGDLDTFIHPFLLGVRNPSRPQE